MTDEITIDTYHTRWHGALVLVTADDGRWAFVRLSFDHGEPVLRAVHETPAYLEAMLLDVDWPEAR